VPSIAAFENALKVAPSSLTCIPISRTGICVLGRCRRHWSMPPKALGWAVGFRRASWSMAALSLDRIACRGRRQFPAVALELESHQFLSTKRSSPTLSRSRSGGGSRRSFSVRPGARPTDPTLMINLGTLMAGRGIREVGGSSVSCGGPPPTERGRLSSLGVRISCTLGATRRHSPASTRRCS
jgi:hypothetical protein